MSIIAWRNYKVHEPANYRKRGRLLRNDIFEIKKRLYNNETQLAIAEVFRIHQSTISRIMSGFIYANYPWPDGTTGPLFRRLNIEHKHEIEKKKSVAWLPPDIMQLANNVQRDAERDNRRELASDRLPPLSDWLLKFPTHKLLKLIEGVNTPDLTYVTELMLFHANEQQMDEIFSHDKRPDLFFKGLEAVAKRTRTTIPDLTQLYNKG